MANKVLNSPVVALTVGVANLLNPPAGSGGVNAGSGNNYIVLRHVRVVNKSVSAATCSFYKGASGGSAAGTETIGTALNVPANSYIDWFGMLRLDSTDFLTGLASANNALVATFEGEVGVA